MLEVMDFGFRGSELCGSWSTKGPMCFFGELHEVYTGMARLHEHTTLLYL